MRPLASAVLAQLDACSVARASHAAGDQRGDVLRELLSLACPDRFLALPSPTQASLLVLLGSWNHETPSESTAACLAGLDAHAAGLPPLCRALLQTLLAAAAPGPFKDIFRGVADEQEAAPSSSADASGLGDGADEQQDDVSCVRVWLAEQRGAAEAGAVPQPVQAALLGLLGRGDSVWLELGAAVSESALMALVRV